MLTCKHSCTALVAVSPLCRCVAYRDWDILQNVITLCFDINYFMINIFQSFFPSRFEPSVMDATKLTLIKSHSRINMFSLW